jgi:hypothetical protein
MDHGKERIEDEAELAAVRRQARRVHQQAAIVTLVAMAIVLALPV